MADEFSLTGSFDSSSYVPFDTDFGALASSSVGSLIPSLAATGSAPVAATSTASTASPTTTATSSSSSGFGGILENIFNTGLGWANQVLAIDVFNRAQTTGVNTSTQQTTSTDTASGTVTTDTLAGVPTSWIVYGGAGLLLLLLLLKFGK